METQTHFNLNVAIENWRQELAAQHDLTPDVRRELETHLRDTVTELQRRGLNDEESFLLARRRVGQPKQLGEEFVKADPVAVWRERIFWMALGYVVFGQLTWMPGTAVSISLNYLSANLDLQRFFLKNGIWFTIVTVLIVGISLARGWFVQSMKPMWFLKNRFQLVALVASLIVLFAFLTQMQIIISQNQLMHPSVVTWERRFQIFRQLLLPILGASAAPLVFSCFVLSETKSKGSQTRLKDHGNSNLF